MFKRILPVEALFLLALMWGVFVVGVVFPNSFFCTLGIQPRSLEGLLGILTSPFLHVGLTHIISNSLPFIFLSTLVYLSVGNQRMLLVMIGGAIGSGVGAWIFSSGGCVVGASGVVFSLIGFLFGDAYYSPSVRSWLVASLSFFVYGGIIGSLFSFLPNISWASHFWGLVSGIIIASILAKKSKMKGHNIS